MEGVNKQCTLSIKVLDSVGFIVVLQLNRYYIPITFPNVASETKQLIIQQTGNNKGLQI